MTANVDLPADQLLLAIDTSGPQLQLAVYGSGFADELCCEIARGHAELIFDQIGQLLQRNQLDYARLTRVAVTTGPGSFTGLRIGIAAARGLALALDIPTIGVQNLLALSLTGVPNEPVDVVIDARRNEAYCQSFTQPGLPLNAPQLINIETAKSDYPRSGVKLISEPRVQIIPLAKFASEVDPVVFPATPTYVRPADAKPQTKGKIALARGANA